MVETYYDAFKINGEIYIINPKDGMVQCVTSQTPTGEELERITQEIGEERKKRRNLMQHMQKELEKAEETQSHLKRLKDDIHNLENAFYYGV